jgi:hypothetical protein
MSTPATCIVLIPIYSENISRLELISLTQCKKILHNYKIQFIGPDRLQINNLNDEVKKDIAAFGINRYANRYFENAKSYNKLLISRQFYKQFEDYDYMLIYHLDAFVFKNDLDFWCRQGYDYIGAPWFKNYSYSTSYDPLVAVGNGGFSLRKISTFLKVLDTYQNIRPFAEYWKHFLEMNWKGKTVHTIPFLFSFVFLNKFHHRFNDFPHNEDFFWGIYADQRLKWFAVPTPDVALGFAMEMHPRKCFELNKNQLPFGCHAWWKYDLDFWEPYIEAFNYEIH